ncbi:MAG: ParB/RepB/Spo0J family partition protein [Clostridia bacterium]|nr:ParB/RepB/Spo0J family partition protein [Clostridia bacterium]
MQVQNWALETLPLEVIRPNPYQPRRHMDGNALNELASSISRYGLLQPIAVRQTGGKWYELVAGERRLRAARLAGLAEIPALIKQTPEPDAAALALVENLQREQLHYLEEAEGYINLALEHGLTQEEVAASVGKTQGSVANKMRLMRLSATVRAKLAASDLTERHARALLRLPEEQQGPALELIINRSYNVAAAEALIGRMLAGQLLDNDKPHKTKQYRDCRILTNTIKSAVQDLRRAGLCADYDEEDCGEWVDIRVRLPKAWIPLTRND